MKIIAVVSGKGGVGKTTLSVSIAHALARDNKVAILDCDLTGSDIPLVIDCDGEPDFIISKGRRARIKPLKAKINGREVNVVSLGLTIPDNSPVLWEESASREAVRQMLELTDWESDYLIVDCPPGSGPEVQEIIPKADYVVIISIPSKLAFGDVGRAIEMMREYGTPILGEIRNMDYLECECGKIHRIFNDTVDLGIPLLFSLPISSTFDGIITLDGQVDSLMAAMDKPVVLKKHSIAGSMKRAIFQKAVINALKED